VSGDGANCPICGRLITGDGPADAGKNMGDHLRDEHGNERKN